MRRLHVGFSGKATWHVALLVFLALTGCHVFSKHKWTPTTVPSKLPFKVSGAKDKRIIAMQTSLRKKGVKVITMGQDYLISIPSTALFPDESPQLKWGGYPILDDVSCYLDQFRKVAVTVTAFSNKCVSARRDKALTLARARAVGDYLWSQGIDSRFVFTQGLGSDKPITSNHRKGDHSLNSRIEITFRDAVA